MGPHMGGSNSDRGFGVATDGSGNAYVTGRFIETVDFDPGPGVEEYSSNRYEDIFLSKFDSSGEFQWVRTCGGSGVDFGNAVAIDGNSDAYVTGRFRGTVDFDPGPGDDVHTENGDGDIFLSKFHQDGNW